MGYPIGGQRLKAMRAIYWFALEIYPFVPILWQGIHDVDSLIGIEVNVGQEIIYFILLDFPSAKQTQRFSQPTSQNHKQNSSILWALLDNYHQPFSS